METHKDQPSPHSSSYKDINREKFSSIVFNRKMKARTLGYGESEYCKIANPFELGVGATADQKRKQKRLCRFQDWVVL